MPVGTMKTEYAEQSIQTIRIHKHNDKDTQHTEFNKSIQNVQPYTERQKKKNMCLGYSHFRVIT
jgi:hypothetical protein